MTESNITDPAGNHARTSIDYAATTLSDGTTINLPQNTYEYQADATTQLRRTHVAYNLASDYTSRRIIGLVSEQTLYGGPTGSETLLSKVSYQYDESGSIQGTDAPVQHDNTDYTASFRVGRGNVSSVKRYDVSSTSFTTSTMQYNTAGAVVAALDPLSHGVTISYTDSFSDDGNSRNTLAYPTTVTDAGGFTSSMKYNYDFGGPTRKQTPLPNVTDNEAGPVQTIEYDSLGRLQKVKNLFNDAYTRYEYPPSQNRVDTYVTILDTSTEAHSFKITDGYGRVIASAADHPGSTGGFSGQLIVYDNMGRVVKTYNPSETSASSTSGSPYDWPTAGDDAQAGWIYTQQTYDWKGRPLVTTKGDSTTKSASYGGCGCAGGAVVTLTDEVGRQQKVYSDSLGRQWKTEVLNSNSSVYSTTTNTLDALDHVTQVTQTDNATSAYQVTTMGYDGYGRLQTKHVPEQNAGTATSYSYNNDDTINSVTDARGASAAYSYNNRRLVTAINYSAPSGVMSTPNVTFAYDAAGNRTSMNDGVGSVSYAYDQLSRMTSETRTFTALPNSFTLTYGYNLAGQLTSLTDPFNGQVTYQRDVIGRVQSMGSSGYVAAYFNGNYDNGSQAVTQITSGIQYRAWGAVKQITYGNGVWEVTSFNARMQPVQFDVNNVRINNPYAYQPPYNTPSATMTWTYDYLADGRAHHAYDQQEHHNDRRWEYDHAGRLQGAYVNHGARGETDPNYEDLYRQTIQYDAWNNITSRTGMVYNLTENDTATYVNNRRQSQYTGQFPYDAEGNLLADTNTHKYNAESQQTHAESSAIVGGGSFPVQPAAELTQTYDGLGSVGIHDAIGHQEDRITDENGNSVVTGISSSEDVTYYVRSTVLGGALITEVVRNYQGVGVKRRTSIYLNGQRIARDGAPGASLGGIEYEHNNPVNGGWVVTNGHPNWRMMNREERDPFGANMASVGQSVSFANLNEGGNATDWQGGCEVDGGPWNCNLIDSENAAPCPKNGCGPRVRDGKLTKPFQAFDDGFSGFLPADAQYIGNGVAFSPSAMGDSTDELAGFIRLDKDSNLGSGGVPFLGTEPQKPALGSFQDCFHRSGLATTSVKGQSADATHFTQDAANLLLDVHNAEGTSLSLLAVTLMNENTTFNLTLQPFVNLNKHGQPLPIISWDVGPFQLNGSYTNAAIESGAIKNGGANFLSYGDIYGMVIKANQPFTGRPLANGRMAARVLNTAGGSTDRQRAINYAQREGRGASYDSFAPLFDWFFNHCYRR